MSFKSAHERLRAIEEKHNLMQFQFAGWRFWPVLRFSASLALLNLSIGSQRGFRLRELAVIGLGDIWSAIRLQPAKYVALTYSSTRRELQGDKSKDVFFDDIALQTGSFCKIEKVNRTFSSRRKAALIKPHLTATAIDLISHFVPKLGLSKVDTSAAHRMSECLQQEPEFAAFTAERLSSWMMDFYWRKRLYSAVFRRIGSKYLMTADGYSDHAAIAAAKECRMIAIEMQHGIVSPYSAGYSWPASAIPYFNEMPVPDRIFMFGRFWKDELDVHGFWGERLRVVGSPLLDAYRKWVKTKSASSRTVNIVVTTQGVETARMLEFFRSFVQLAADGCIDYTLTFKLHPSNEDDKTPYEDAFGPNRRVRVFGATEGASTLALVADADLHVSTHSACHYQAIALGVETVILPFKGHELVLNLFEAGHARLANSPEEFLDMVRSPRSTIAEEIRSYYYEPRAIENILREIACQPLESTH